MQTDLSTTFAVYFTLFDNCIAVRGKTNYVRSSSADGLYLYGNLKCLNDYTWLSMYCKMWSGSWAGLVIITKWNLSKSLRSSERQPAPDSQQGLHSQYLSDRLQKTRQQDTPARQAWKTNLEDIPGSHARKTNLEDTRAGQSWKTFL